MYKSRKTTISDRKDLHINCKWVIHRYICILFSAENIMHDPFSRGFQFGWFCSYFCLVNRKTICIYIDWFWSHWESHVAQQCLQCYLWWISSRRRTGNWVMLFLKFFSFLSRFLFGEIFFFSTFSSFLPFFFFVFFILYSFLLR